jgi:type IV secretory pathway VirJ component
MSRVAALLAWAALALACTGQARARPPVPAPLPLHESPVPGSDRLVILLSGDGGWRALVRGIDAELNRQGVAVVGWNSLGYFWQRRTPQQAGADLARVIEDYTRRWHVREVALVGYSFGADVLPFLYNALPAGTRARVRFVALLGLAPQADFKARAGGWLGWGPRRPVAVLPQVARMPAARVQCIHGREERDSLCPRLAALGVAVAAAPGGHHFQGDAAGLARIIVQGWRRTPPLPATG